MQEEKNQPNNPSSGGSSKGFKGRILPIILAGVGLVIVLLLIGGGAMLAGHRWDPKWNPFKPSSDKVIRENFLKEIKK